MEKTKRIKEVKLLKQKRKELLKELNLSLGKFKKDLPRVLGSGYKFFIPENTDRLRNRYGHRMSLRQQISLLYEMIAHSKELKEFIEKELQKKASEAKETEDAK